LVSLAIFTIISLGTVRQIQQIASTKKSSFEDLDTYNNIRAALSMIRTDLSQTFHVPYDELGSDVKQRILQNQPVAHTMFDGRKKELIFTTLSHRNYYRGRRESEQTEISYFLNGKQGRKLPSLMKRESELIDGDLYQGGSIYTLLDDVVELEFNYWDEKTGKWVDDWGSDTTAYRDRFPLAVKIKLTAIGQNEQKLKVETKFKVAFPNNDPMVAQF
jgi:type II secretion system protein J